MLCVRLNNESNFMEIIDKYFNESSRVIDSLNKDQAIIELMARKIFELKKTDNKIMIGGNGGSCADAEHFAGELVCTFKDPKRRGVSGISLTNNSSAITAWSNDFGFNTFFARQVESLGNTGDILFLISTGGGNKENGASMNLVLAAEKAKEMGIQIFSISGKGGGILKDFSDLSVVVDSDVTSNIQEAHIVIIHMICLYIDYLDKEERATVD